MKYFVTLWSICGQSCTTKQKFYRDPFILVEKFPRQVKNKFSESIIKFKQGGNVLVVKNVYNEHHKTNIVERKLKN